MLELAKCTCCKQPTAYLNGNYDGMDFLCVPCYDNGCDPKGFSIEEARHE